MFPCIKDCLDTPGCADWKLILADHEIKVANYKIASYINNKFRGENIIVVCILKGAVYFHVDLTRMLTVPHSQYFIEASSYHNAQTQSEQVELLSKIVPSKFVGKKVILIDELYDNGTTLNNIKVKISELANVKLDDIFTCTIFKKDKKTNQPDPDLFGILVPNVWLVGYGLDDRQEKRNWGHLFAVPKTAEIEETMDDNLFTDPEYYDKIRKQIGIYLSKM